MRFRDRADAGRRLATRLLPYRGEHVCVLGLARGGMRVAYEVARALEAPLDVWVSRRLGIPGRMTVLGAVSEGGGLYLDRDALRLAPIPEVEILSMARELAFEVDDEVRRLRVGAAPDVVGRVVLLVDDGLVSGASAVAALQALRGQRPARLILAAPVATPHALDLVRGEADAVHCLETVPALGAVSEVYDECRPLPDADVRQLVARSREPGPPRDVLEATDLGGFWM
ncbi:phosphoribosyltransferase [Pyxidicoccus xibeiensis]|uniref:phosphoribosyltransferase n=1 Tax=Pyxidicoccus xibeiensis TaxID=2906759 RepID=UPI0020A6EA5C|nr:phosphoribosyltransferase family protein [Pyxidicoccus xibeiensis]MCP3143912.1 phosphoribosyl transferase [Pyxidicoccus xibeiensis]